MFIFFSKPFVFIEIQVLQGGCTESPTKPKGRPRKEMSSVCNNEQEPYSANESCVDVEQLHENDSDADDDADDEDHDERIVNADNSGSSVGKSRGYLRPYPINISASLTHCP